MTNRTAEEIRIETDNNLINNLLCLQEEIGDFITFIDEREPEPTGTDRYSVYTLELSNYMAEILRMKEIICNATANKDK